MTTNSYYLMYLVENLLNNAENRYQLTIGISRQTRQNFIKPKQKLDNQNHELNHQHNQIIETILEQNQNFNQNKTMKFNDY